MIKYLIFFLLFAQSVFAGGVLFMAGGVEQAGGGVFSCTVGYDVCEDAEGVGEPAGWTTTAASTATFDWDYDVTPLEGLESLLLTGDSDSTGAFAVYTAASSATTKYARFAFKPTILKSGADSQFTQMTKAGGAGIAKFGIDSTGAWYASHGASRVTGGSATLNTLYYIWIDTTTGTGANGQAHIYVSETKTKPGSPIVSLTNGTDTDTPISNIVLHGSNQAQSVFDTIEMGDAALGDF